MKKKVNVKISVILVLMVLLTQFHGMELSRALAEDGTTVYPQLLIEGNSTLSRFGSAYINAAFAANISFNENDNAPVEAASAVECTSANTLANCGLRNNNASLFMLDTANSYVGITYWVMADLADTSVTPKIKGNIQYCTSTGSGGKFVEAIDGVTGEMTLESGKWYKCFQIFNIADTQYLSNDITYDRFRFVVCSGVPGQKTYVGGFAVYDFGTEFSYNGKQNNEAIDDYISDASLTGITVNGTTVEGFAPEIYDYSEYEIENVAATSNIFTEISYDTTDADKTIILTKAYNADTMNEFNVSVTNSKTYTVQKKLLLVPILKDTYDMGMWTMAGVGYRGAARPEIVDVEGQVFDKAMRFWGQDSAYTEDDKKSYKYRAQLSSSYIADSKNITVGDRIYISFYAKAYSKYGNQCIVQPMLQSEASGGTGLSTGYYGASINPDDSWKKYSLVIPISNEQNANTVGLRFIFNLGYYGQVTYISDVNIYKCDRNLSESALNELLKDTENIQKVSADNADTGLRNTGTYKLSVEPSTEEVTGMPFSTAYVFGGSEAYNTDSSITSKIDAYSSRINTSYIDQNSVKTNDIFLLTYWAKGEVNPLYSSETSTFIVPKLQKDENGSNKGNIFQIDAAGNTDQSQQSLDTQWKKYGYIYKIPDMGTYGLRIQLDIGLRGQTTYLANVQLYNLGTVTTDYAYQLLTSCDVGEAYYNTRSMVKNNNTYTALVGNGISSISDDEFKILSKYPFQTTEMYAVPSEVGDSGHIKVISANGQESIYDVNTQSLERMTKEAVKFYSGNAMNAILKFDDLYPGSIDAFSRVAAMAKENNFEVSFAAIGSSWVDATDEQWAVLKQWQDDGIEIVCHGWDHTEQEFSTASYDEQKQALSKYVELMSEHGINTVSFSSPFNNSTVVTSRVLNDNFSDINTVLLTNQNTVGTQTVLSNRLNIESETGVADYSTFTENWASTDAKDYVVVQSHPAEWNEASFTAFSDAVKYLFDNGIDTMTPCQYNSFMKSKQDLTSITGGKVTAEVVVSSGAEDGCNAVIIYALYNKADGSIEGIKTKKIYAAGFEEATEKLTMNIPENSSSYNVKAFVWYDMDGINPVGEVSELK